MLNWLETSFSNSIKFENCSHVKEDDVAKVRLSVSCVRRKDIGRGIAINILFS